MRFTIDDEAGVLIMGDREVPLHDKEAFSVLSRAWVRTGWALRYSYGFTWLGRPVIQLPEDIVRTQEVIWSLKPDVIVETGIAHGGSLVLHASLLELIGHGKVVGIDIDIREHNRAALEGHALSERISLIEGSSTDEAVLAQVKEAIGDAETVLVLLDSDHSRDHVLDELRAYAAFVTPGSWIVATDGVMKDLTDVPGGHPTWSWDNPCTAVETFLGEHPEFVFEPPGRPFDETAGVDAVTYWPQAWLRREADDSV